MIDRYDKGITPSQIYKINQLQAVWIADLAWCEVDTTTIQNCWRKAGILPGSAESHPINPSIPISSLLQHPSESLQENPAVEAERQVKATLDDLVAMGHCRR